MQFGPHSLRDRPGWSGPVESRGLEGRHHAFALGGICPPPDLLPDDGTRAIPTTRRRMEGAIALSLEHGADGDAETLSANHRDRFAGRPVNPGGVAARAPPVVLGLGIDYRGESRTARCRWKGPTDGRGLD